MLHHIKKLFGVKPKAEAQVEVPYKVEIPVTPVADDVTRAMLESIPAKKTASAPKKPRAPRKPKSE
jgi:hypothetical protein